MHLSSCTNALTARITTKPSRKCSTAVTRKKWALSNTDAVFAGKHVELHLPANTPDDPKGYRVLPAKAFQQRFIESFDIVPEVVGEFGNS